MKKRFILSLMCILSLAFTACAETSAETKTEGQSIENQTQSKIITICTEESLSFETDSICKEIQNSIQLEGVTYQFTYLPYENPERQNELNRLKAEIMAGKGPDVFLMDTDPIRQSSQLGEIDFLFPNVIQAVKNGYFADLTEYADKSDAFDTSLYYDSIMNAGVWEDKRYILPIQFTVPSIVVTDDAIKNPKFAFKSFDELLQSDEEILKAVVSGTGFFYFSDLFGEYIDYETNCLRITANELSETANQLGTLFANNSMLYEDLIGVYVPEYSNIGMKSYRYNPYDPIDNPKDYFTVPFPNSNGGVTASVTMWGAVNANSNNIEAAYQFLEVLLSEQLQCEKGEELYYFDNGANLSVLKSAVQKCAGKTCSEATVESFEEAISRVDSVKFYTEFDNTLMMTDGILGTTKPDEVIRMLQMQLDE